MENMSRLKKIANGMLVIGLMFCFFGGIIYAVAPDITVKISHYIISNLDNGEATVGFYTRIPDAESENSKQSVNMAVYDNMGNVFSNFSNINTWREGSDRVESRYISLPSDFMDGSVNTDYKLQIDTDINGIKSTVIKEFDVRSVYSISANVNFFEKPSISGDKIKCSWSPLEGATGYDVVVSPYSFVEEGRISYETDSTSIEIPTSRFESWNACYVYVIAKKDLKRIGRSESWGVILNSGSPLPTSTVPVPISEDYKFTVSGFVQKDLPGSVDQNWGLRSIIKDSRVWTWVQSDGNFVVPYVLKNPLGYVIEITNDAYLTRYIGGVKVLNDVQIGTKDFPIMMWPGDLNNDNAINMVDILEIAKYFNTTSNSSDFKYNYDFNMDYAINLADILIVAKHFNKTSTDYPEFKMPIPTNMPTPTYTPTSTPTATATPTPTNTPTPNFKYQDIWKGNNSEWYVNAPIDLGPYINEASGSVPPYITELNFTGPQTIYFKIYNDVGEVAVTIDGVTKVYSPMWMDGAWAKCDLFAGTHTIILYAKRRDSTYASYCIAYGQKNQILTATPTPTATPTATPTNIPSFGGALYVTNALGSSPEDNCSHMAFDWIFFNHSDAPISIDTLRFRYYYSANGIAENVLNSQIMQSDFCAYTDMDSTNAPNITPRSLMTYYRIKIEPRVMVTTPINLNADHYLDFSFERLSGSSVTIKKNCYLEMHFVVYVPGWPQIYNNSDDYSYMPRVWNPTEDETLTNVAPYIGAINGSAYHLWKKIAIYAGSGPITIWGEEPSDDGMLITPTPGAGAPTPTTTVIATPYSTPISTPHYPAWDPNSHVYNVGDKVTYSGAIYQCIFSHTSNPLWTPWEAGSLWRKM